MTSNRIKMIHNSNFQVCRFCLHANATDLSSIFDEISENVIAMNQTIQKVLKMLEIQISSGDLLPKLVCISCRDTLVSISHFQRNAQRSFDLLEKAMETKPGDLTLVKNSDTELSLDETFDGLEPDAVEDYDPHQEIAEVKEELEVSTSAFSIVEVEDQAKNEEYLEEDFLEDDGFIPVQDDGQIIVYSKPKAPKTTRKPNAKVCTICGAKTTAMSVHMRTHTNDRPFACSMCDMKFYTNGKLRCHFDSVHIGERKFSCEICGKSFVLKKNLKAHIMSHSAKREHVCSHCSKSFLFRWSLTAHERIHTGERPYVCTWQNCGKRFVTVSNLIQHQKTTNHWKEAPEEKCPLCSKVFQTKASLKAHNTKTHGLGAHQ
nr:zinc finger protein 613-like [Aedes albopictus]